MLFAWKKQTYLFRLSHFTDKILGISIVLQLTEVIQSSPVKWLMASFGSGLTRKPRNTRKGTLAQVSQSGTKVQSSYGDTVTRTVETQGQFTNQKHHQPLNFPLCPV